MNFTTGFHLPSSSSVTFLPSTKTNIEEELKQEIDIAIHKFKLGKNQVVSCKIDRTKICSDIYLNMNTVISNTISGIKTIPNQKFILGMNRLLPIFSERQWSIDILDILFDSKICDQTTDFRPVWMKNRNVCFLKYNINLIIRENTKKIYYMNFFIQDEKTGLSHKNILLVDTISNPPCVYRIEPQIVSTDYNFIDDLLYEYIIKNTVFVYKGNINKTICNSCKNISLIQKKLGGNYCMVYSLFIVYLLIQYNKTNISNFLNGKDVNKKSYIYKLSSVTNEGQLRYMVAMFAKKISLIYLSCINTNKKRTDMIADVFSDLNTKP